MRGMQVAKIMLPALAQVWYFWIKFCSCWSSWADGPIGKKL